MPLSSTHPLSLTACRLPWLATGSGGAVLPPGPVASFDPHAGINSANDTITTADSAYLRMMITSFGRAATAHVNGASPPPDASGAVPTGLRANLYRHAPDPVS